MDGTSAVVSDDINETIGEQIVFVGVQIVTAGEDVNADLDVEMSHDGTTWFAAVNNASADLAPNVTGDKMATADLSTISAPFYRLAFNNAGVDVGDFTLATYTTVLAGANNVLLWTAVDAEGTN